ncbi:hypothetical protein E6C70_14125 [Glaciibacter flavus]|uniref:Uncharacterized protein n=1 Tax=Orlajensenia flava TaxID=2565934 RepID=A0A4S4FLX3_9MICO|nr:hypothetical protein [Glaciibacter flavus]THG31188.1 hypothetical protein E6C70_14125 [Glaciibacter flavus]
METTSRTYTAKLMDGPLEGRTIATRFSEAGEPQPRIEIPTGTADKRYLYVRGAGREFDAEGDERPTAVDYRFLEALFG